MRRILVLTLAVFLLSVTVNSFAQQTDIRQFAAFSAYSYLNTPSLGLTQHGFNADVGFNYKPWLTFGFDFSTLRGSSSLSPSSLNAFTQAKLIPYLPLLPPGFTVPYETATYTYEAGPQLNYRHFKKLTFFVRPALGGLHSKFTVTSTDPLTIGIVHGLLGGSSTSDTVMFYGVGGGFTWEINPTFGLRVATDFAHFNFFSAALNGGRNSVRVSVGPKFGFGKNILQKQ